MTSTVLSIPANDQSSAISSFQRRILGLSSSSTRRTTAAYAVMRHPPDKVISRLQGWTGQTFLAVWVEHRRHGRTEEVLDDSRKRWRHVIVLIYITHSSPSYSSLFSILLIITSNNGSRKEPSTKSDRRGEPLSYQRCQREFPPLTLRTRAMEADGSL